MGRVMRYPTTTMDAEEPLGRIESSDLKNRAEREDFLSGLVSKPCIYIEQTHTGTFTEKFFVHLVCLCGICFGMSPLFCCQPIYLDYLVRSGAGIASLLLWVFYIYKNSCF